MTEVSHTVGRPYSERVYLKNGRCKETGKKSWRCMDLIEIKIFILDYRAEIKLEGGKNRVDAKDSQWYFEVTINI